MTLPLARLAKDGERGMEWPKSTQSELEYLAGFKRQKEKKKEAKRVLLKSHSMTENAIYKRNVRAGLHIPKKQQRLNTPEAAYYREWRARRNLKNAAASSAKQQP